MPDIPQLGPVALCTLIARDGQAMVDAYTGWLYQRVSSSGPMDADSAAALGYPQLEGNRQWLLANESGRQWLQILECEEAVARDSLNSFGWMALEVLVADADGLVEHLEQSPFEILRPPADLDVSDKIRAFQVRGPAGEILYLTQVNGEVPPFDLPVCTAPVDHLFIPVLSTPSREGSLAQYAAISGTAGLSFDTKITVVNQARGFELDLRHPVATLQLAGQSLVEIDEIAQTKPAPAGVSSGMACVAFHCSDPTPADTGRASQGAFGGKLFSSHEGCAGEHFTLVYP